MLDHVNVKYGNLLLWKIQILADEHLDESVTAAVNVNDRQARVRLVKRKEELEELLQDLEQRLDEGEVQITAAAAEKKKLLTNVQDLEEQCVLVLVFC